jgi:hypothetical protein
MQALMSYSEFGEIVAIEFYPNIHLPPPFRPAFSDTWQDDDLFANVCAAG